MNQPKWLEESEKLTYVSLGKTSNEIKVAVAIGNTWTTLKNEIDWITNWSNFVNTVSDELEVWNLKLKAHNSISHYFVICTRCI